ncbi:MAG: hypothetical protein ACYDGN_09365 [Acidimicrobiales bacterium]
MGRDIETVASRSSTPDAGDYVPTRGAAVGAVALLPIILVVTYIEVLAAIADSLSDIHARSHHPTGPLWLGIFALLGVAGPVAAGMAVWHTKAERKSSLQAILRGEMAFLLIGLPATFLLLVT